MFEERRNKEETRVIEVSKSLIQKIKNFTILPSLLSVQLATTPSYVSHPYPSSSLPHPLSPHLSALAEQNPTLIRPSGTTPYLHSYTSSSLPYPPTFPIHIRPARSLTLFLHTYLPSLLSHPLIFTLIRPAHYHTLPPLLSAQLPTTPSLPHLYLPSSLPHPSFSTLIRTARYHTLLSPPLSPLILVEQNIWWFE